MEEVEPIKKIIIDKISSFIKQVIPNGDVEVYGSHATKLCLHWSDVDLVLKPLAKDARSGQGSGDVYGNSRSSTDGGNSGSGIGFGSMPNMRSWLSQLHNELVKSENRDWLHKVEFIENTTVPVIKLACSFHQLTPNASG